MTHLRSTYTPILGEQVNADEKVVLHVLLPYNDYVDTNTVRLAIRDNRNAVYARLRTLRIKRLVIDRPGPKLVTNSPRLWKLTDAVRSFLLQKANSEERTA